jgi:hypothetical protein
MVDDAPPSRSLFRRVDDHTVIATDLARGPWDPRALHGGPPAALLADAIEQVDSGGVDWFVSRLTVELERPVPLEPLTVDTHVLRPGRKVSVVEATIRVAANGTVLARARALRIRSAAVPLPHHDAELAPMLAIDQPPAGPEHGSDDVIKETDYVGFHNGAVEHRFVDLAGATNGEVFDWIRMIVPVLPDRPLTPLQRVAGAADFANGISHVLPFETHTFVNPDLTIHLFQPLRGEWVGMLSTTHHGVDGVGLSDTVLYDVDGRIGRANQSLLLDLR